MRGAEKSIMNVKFYPSKNKVKNVMVNGLKCNVNCHYIIMRF